VKLVRASLVSSDDIMSKAAQRTRSVGTETRGDDPKTSSGRRDIAQSSTTQHLRAKTRASTSQQMEGALTMPENQKAPGTKAAWGSLEDKKRHRSKRCGYDHRAAKPSHDDLFGMPAGGIPDSVGRADSKRFDPFRHNSTAAGLNSGRIEDAAAARTCSRSGYFPIDKNNPINHTVPSTSEAVWDERMTTGSAGVSTDRLTRLRREGMVERPESTSVGEEQDKDKKPKERSDKAAKSTFNVIAHDGDEAPSLSRGRRRFHSSACHKDSVAIKHQAGRPEPLSPEAVIKWRTKKQVQVRGGQYRYNVAGHEDMLPAATEAYTKADRPPSNWYRQENDKQCLPSFYTQTGNDYNDCKDKHQASEDLAYIFGKISDPPLTKQERQRVMSIQGSSEGNRTPPQPQTSRGAKKSQQKQPMRSQSARMLPSDGGQTPPRGYSQMYSAQRQSYRPEASSDGGRSYRSVTPPPRFSPPTRSQGSGSVYSADVDPKSRHVWSTPNLLNMSSTPRQELEPPPMF